MNDSENRERIKEILINLNEFKSTWFYGIYPRVSKEQRGGDFKIICDHLAEVLEWSQKNWRRATVIPFFKKEKKENI